jgi:hypothetical protein
LQDGTPHKQIRDTRAVWQELGAAGSLPERHRNEASECMATLQGRYWARVWAAGYYVKGPMLLELWRPTLARLAAVDSEVALYAAQLSDGLTEVGGRLQSLSKHAAPFDYERPEPGSEIPADQVEIKLDELDQFEHILDLAVEVVAAGDRLAARLGTASSNTAPSAPSGCATGSSGRQ